MRDSVPSPRYSHVCNVLRQWKTSLIPTYRVYRLYDIRIYMYIPYFWYVLRGSIDYVSIISMVEVSNASFASGVWIA